MSQREQRAAQQQARPELRAEQPKARLVRLVQRRLQVAAIEGFFGQGDDQELTREITAECAHAWRMKRHLDAPPPKEAEPERRKQDQRGAERPGERAAELARDASERQRFRIEQARE